MDLQDSEKLVFEGHPSWRSTLGFYIKGLAATALVTGLAAGVTAIASGGIALPVVGIAAVVASALVLIVGFLKRWATTYTISDRRLHIRRGIIARRIQETRIERVQNVNISQSVLERLLQVGTVDFDTAGTDDSEFAFGGVADPEEVMRSVEQAQATSPAGV